MRTIGITKIQKSILKPFCALAMYPRAVSAVLRVVSNVGAFFLRPLSRFDPTPSCFFSNYFLTAQRGFPHNATCIFAQSVLDFSSRFANAGSHVK